MMSHSESAVMLFTEMDQPAEGQMYRNSGLGSLPKDNSLGLDLSQFENYTNDEDQIFDLLREDEEGRNWSGVGVDELGPEAAGSDDGSFDPDEFDRTVQSLHEPMSDDHDYGKSHATASNAENDVDELSSPLRSGVVSIHRRVVTRSERPKRAAVLKKRAVSICSDSSEDMEPRKVRHISTSAERSNSKNAIAARENREKKKQYVANLERDLKHYKEENSKNVALLDTFKKNQEALVTEVQYLRGCLANSAEISAVIREVKKIPNVKQVTTSLGINSKNQESRKRCLRSENEENESGPAKKKRLQALTGSDRAGICVHVNDGAISLEFCSQCHRSAKIASKP